MTVSGKSDDCLPLLQPHLAIPCEEEWLEIAVTKDGTALSDVRFEDGMALFPVAAAGTYTITATEVEQTLAVSQAIEAPDGSFDLMDELQTSVALTVPYKAYYTVSTVGLTTEQLGDGAAVTSSDPAIFTVQKAGTAEGAAVFAFTATGIGTASLQYTVDGKTLSVPVTTAAPCAAGIPGGITVGFASYMNPEETMLWLSTNDQPRSFGSSFHPDEEDDTYRPCRPVMVRAGIASDSAGLYEECKDVELEILRLGIQPLTGGDVFSWSPDEVQTELVPDGDLDRVQLYAKNREGNARLWAEVRINGENTVVISARTDMQKIQIIAPEEVDTIPEVEAYLTENKLQGGVIYRFTLKPGKHTDTLDLPENLMGRMIYLCGAENGSTIVEGGIDLHGSGLTEVSGICFTAPDGGSQKAIYGGSVMSVKNCSFYNYDTALDSTAAGLVNPGTGNLFVNNKTAISVDVAQVKQIAHVLCDRNTFINNGTALKVISLHEAVGPFRFRITNSNFINNGLDFDVAYPGTYYFYKNYFGAYDKAGGNPQPGQTAADKSNGRADLELDRVLQARSLNSLKGLLDTRTARIQTAEGVRTITNPRWAYPVAKWWHKDTLDEAAVFGDNILIRTAAAPASGEEEYVNYLTSDWDGTEIINAESTELVLDAKAFEAEAEEKTIDVVQVTDNGSQVDTEVIGTWTFD